MIFGAARGPTASSTTRGADMATDDTPATEKELADLREEVERLRKEKDDKPRRWGRGAGAIVHVASISASFPQGYSGAYSASKAGVVMVSRQLAVEWGPRGVRSNVVSPGMIRTPMTEAIYQAAGVHEARRALVPARRIGRPEDIADAVVFLASERASYITGEEIVVDGGLTRTLMGTIPRPGFEKD